MASPVARAAFAGVLVLAAPLSPVAAQSGKSLPTRLEWRVEGDARDLSKISELTVGPTGIVAAALPQDNSVRLFSAQGRAIGTIGPNGMEQPEFDQVNRMGWKGDSLWVFDGRYQRVSIIRPTGSLLRRLPMPFEATRPARTPGELVAAITPVKFLAGDSLVVTARTGSRTLAVISSPTLFRTTAALNDFALVASLPTDRCRAMKVSTRAGCNIGLSAFSPNGDWVAISEIPAISPNAEAFTLRLLSARGDTVFSRQVTPPVVKPRWSALPPYLLVGSDGTVWVGGASDAGVQWLLFDRNGLPLGSVTVPRNYRVAAVSRTRAWAIETDAKGVESIVQVGVEVRP